ncbi:MAG: hypothetical protein R3F11_24470, partial [Verrucomicrobiales bacterium]
IDAAAAAGRDRFPRNIRFTTWTLRYPSMHWVQIDAMQEHWARARVEADIASENAVIVRTENVAALTLALPPGQPHLAQRLPVRVAIDGQAAAAPPVMSDRSWAAHFVKTDGKWAAAPKAGIEGLAKRPGLQGPVDDAFMGPFVFVRPTGQPLHARAGDWAKAELDRAIVHWRQQFRGDAPVADDAAVTEADIASKNLVLWGDPQSNAVLAKIADQLPVIWEGGEIKLGGSAFPADSHAPILIYPNPLNPDRYVVLNSGVTYREYDYLNNARQVPKLPDYAIIDLSEPPGSQRPGRIAQAGFFGERWEVKE